MKQAQSQSSLSRSTQRLTVSSLSLSLGLTLSACGAPPPAPPAPPAPAKREPPAPSAEELKARAEAEAQREATEATEAAERAEREAEAQAAQESAAAEAQTQSFQLLIEARAALIKGDLEAANGLYSRVAERTPEIPEAHYNLGVLAERSGLPQVARGHYEEALKAQADFSPAWLALVRFSLRAGDAQGALNSLESRLRAEPENIALLNAKCSVLNALKTRRAEVIETSKAVLRRDEQNVPAMINLAAAFEMESKHELAIAVLENAKALDPDNPEVYARLARSQEALDEPLKARFTLEAAVQLPEGSSAEIHNQLGLIYLKAGDFPSAEERFKSALRLWPQMVEAQVNLGNALKGQQRFVEASDAFIQALSMRADFPPALFNLGILYLDGRFDEMKKLDQLSKAQGYFKAFQAGSPSAEDAQQIEAFMQECARLIEVQQKLMEQAAQAPPPEPLDEPALDAPVDEPALDAPVDEPLDEPALDAPVDEPLDEPTLDSPADAPLDAAQPPPKDREGEAEEDEPGVEVEELELDEPSAPAKQTEKPAAQPRKPELEPELELEIEEVEL